MDAAVRSQSTPGVFLFTLSRSIVENKEGGNNDLCHWRLLFNKKDCMLAFAR